MNKQDYIKIINEKISGSAKDILLKQVDLFYEAIDNFKQAPHNYKKGDLVRLDKGTLLHGTYKNIEGLEKIAKEGLILDTVSETELTNISLSSVIDCIKGKKFKSARLSLSK